MAEARAAKTGERTSRPSTIEPGAELQLRAVVLRVFGRQAQVQVAGELVTVDVSRLKELLPHD